MSGIRVNEWLHNSGTGGIWQTSAGNVGVASSAPTAKLVVTGDVNVSGALTATNFNGGQVGNRNKIVNGGWQVSQRGDITHSYSWAGDRFQNRTGSSVVMTRTGDVPVGFSSAMLFTAGSGTLTFKWNTLVEAGDNLKGTGIQNVYGANTQWTVSLWATAAVNVKVGFCNDNGAGDFQTIQALTAMESTGETSNNYTRYKKTFSIASITPHANNKGIQVQYEAVSAASAIKFTGAQLERGAHVTPFEHKSYAQDLLDCQRYYYRVYANNNIFFPGMGMADTDGNTVILNTQLPVVMRGEPSALEQTGTAGDYKIRRSTTATCSAVPTFGHASKYHVSTNFTSASHGFGDGSAVRCMSGTTDAYLGWDAEL